MWNEIALVLSSLGVGGLLGVFAKSILDKRQLKFSKVFDYKEVRYKAITIRNWIGLPEFVIPDVHSVAAGGQGFSVRSARGSRGRLGRRG